MEKHSQGEGHPEVNGWNGQRAKFWLDWWVGEGPLVDVATQQIPPASLNARVCDYIDEDGNWKWSYFVELIPMNLIPHIRQAFSRGELHRLSDLEGLSKWKLKYEIRLCLSHRPANRCGSKEVAGYLEGENHS